MSSIVETAVNGGELMRRPPKLHRYKPVPPYAVDEDGYPCEDSMSQDTDHIALFGYGLALKRHLKGKAAVHSDLSTHYLKGDRGAVIVPDLFVAFGAEECSAAHPPPPQQSSRPPPPQQSSRPPPPQQSAYRRSYKLWEDPSPDFVLEVLSKKTWRNDVGLKKDTYEFLGVRECWLYDPRVRWLATPLEGYRLRGGAYERIEPVSEGRFESEALGLELHLRGGELRFFDPEAGVYLRTLDEAEQQVEEAEQRVREHERELAALRAQLAQRG